METLESKKVILQAKLEFIHSLYVAEFLVSEFSITHT